MLSFSSNDDDESFSSLVVDPLAGSLRARLLLPFPPCLGVTTSSTGESVEGLGWGEVLRLRFDDAAEAGDGIFFFFRLRYPDLNGADGGLRL